MNKLAHRILAFSLSFLLAINTAAAGRWFQCCIAPDDVCPPVACGPVCGPTYSCGVDYGTDYYGCCEPTVVYRPTCGRCGDCGSETYVSNNCDCDSSPVVESPTYSEPTYQAPAPSPAPALPTPIATEAPLEPAPEAMFDSEPVAPVDAFSEAPEVTEEPADLFEELPAEEPAAFNEPNDDLFGEVMPAEEAADEVAVGDEVAFGEEPMDAFGEEGFTSDEEAPAAEDNMFADEPAEGGMEEEPADDLFGEEPADDFGDDAFGDEGFADEAFGEETGVEETPSFGEETPADDAPADDALFGEEPAQEAAGDLFGEEPTEDAGDLFGGEDFGDTEDFAPADEMPAEEAAPADEAIPAEEGPAEEGPSDEEAFDDLFGAFGAILYERGGYFSTTDRSWVDNTGTFSCVGRLVAVEGTNVRLLKANGSVAIVPLGRLSSRDLEFVNRQASAQYEVELIRTAQR